MQTNPAVAQSKTLNASRVRIK